MNGDPTSAAMLVGILVASAKAGLLLACCGLFAALWGRRCAPLRHALWTLGLAGALLLLLAAPLPAVWQVVLPRSEPVPLLDVPAGPGASLAGWPNEAPEAAAPVAHVTPSDPPGGGSLPWARWLLWLWAGGAALLLTQRALAALGARGLVREGRAVEDVRRAVLQRGRRLFGVRRPVGLVESSRVGVPLVVSARRPVVILPVQARQWDALRLAAVLAHELAHVKRRDNLTSSIGWIACALHWFNPLLWYALYRQEIERERACDDLVLSAGARDVDYAAELVGVARDLAEQRALVGLGLFGRSALEGRIRGLLQERNDRVIPAGRLRLLGLPLLAAMVSLACLGFAVEGPASRDVPVSRDALAVPTPLFAGNGGVVPPSPETTAGRGDVAEAVEGNPSSDRCQRDLHHAREAYVAGWHDRAIDSARSAYRRCQHREAPQIIGASACLTKRLGLVRWAYERLDAGRRRMLRQVCARQGIDLERADRPPQPEGNCSELLNQARAAYVAGHFAEATDAARRVHAGCRQGSEALQIIGASACQTENAKLARWAYRRLEPGKRNILPRVCARYGIELDRAGARTAKADNATGGSGRVRRAPNRAIGSSGGHLARAAIQKVVSQHLHRVQACYERELVSNPSLSGQIVFDWLVTPSGSVGMARQVSFSMRSPAVSACVLRLIRSWRFPRPVGGSVKVRYPFVFSASGS